MTLKLLAFITKGVVRLNDASTVIKPVKTSIGKKISSTIFCQSSIVQQACVV